MTKEELLNKKFSIADFGERKDALYFSDLMNFFESNVVIHKGENRHPYADVLHEWVEGSKMQKRYMVKDDTIQNQVRTKWIDFSLSANDEYRIKQKEPVYEALVRINYSDGTYDDTERYFTHEEFEQFGFPKSCEWAIETKRER